ncbi:surface antigen TASV, putative,hypothetical protein, partial [Trypanosoma cruzi marinkellei]
MMMVMVTVRRRVACNLLVLALLCCCCFSVCRASDRHAEESATVGVVVSCPGTDGNLGWRLLNETSWRNCSKKPGEVNKANDDCEQVCVAAENFYQQYRVTKSLCIPFLSNQTYVAFGMNFSWKEIENCSLAAEVKNTQHAANAAQQLPSQQAAAAPAVAPAPAAVGQAQSGAAPTPGKSSERTEKGDSGPLPIENGNAIPLTAAEGAVQSGKRDGKSVVDEEVHGGGKSLGNLEDATPPGGDANEHVASAPEASSQSSSSPSRDDAEQGTSHNNNEDGSQPGTNGEGTDTVPGTTTPQPTTDGSENGT